MKKPYCIRVDAFEIGMIVSFSFVVGWIAYGVFRLVLAA